MNRILKHSGILSLLLIVPLLLSSRKGTNFSKNAPAPACEQIKELKNGILLVRLMTKSNTINALNKQGKEVLAKNIQEKQRLKNLKIIEGFKKEFDFCQVLFFFSKSTESIRTGEIDEVVFVDEQLLPDSSIQIGDRSFYVGKFGTISQESNGKIQQGTKIALGAFVIMDSSLKQLDHPFPYYTRTYDSGPRSKKPDLVARRMNGKLHKYYQKCYGVSN